MSATTACVEETTHRDFIRYYAEKYEWIFEPPSIREVPEPNEAYISSPCLSPEFAMTGLRMTAILKSYITDTYIIKDHFGKDHDARRAFYKQQDIEAEIWLDEHSKLKVSKLFPVIGMMDMIMESFLVSHHQLYETLKEEFDPGYDSLIDELLYKYRNMEFDQKVAFAKRIDKIAYGFLEILSKPVLSPDQIVLN